VNAVDLVLLLVLAAAALLGFFQGVIRSLLAIGAWAVSFLLAANLRDPVGRYLASQWTSLSADYVYMLAFGSVAIVLLVVLLGAIRVRARWSARLYALLQDSTVGRTVIGFVTPVMDVLFGPLTPQVVRDAIG